MSVEAETGKLDPANIEHASRVIDPVFRGTPQFRDPFLAERLGKDVVVKVESVNPVRSFKGRGADYCLSRLDAQREVVCASAGNFGQAIAYAGRARGIAVSVFAATTANPAKVARMRALGANVVLVGHDFDAAKNAAREHAKQRPGALFLEDGEDPRVAEGAGTIGLELAAVAPDTLLVPVGNGALIAGVGCWMRFASPDTRVVGVCAAGAPAMEISWRRGEPVCTDTTSTIADGVAVRVPVPAAVTWMQHYVDDVLLVDDEQILQAVRIVDETLGLPLEPAGAIGIAAAMEYDGPGEILATVLTGSNFAPELLDRIRR
ncbi:MAG TPA: pyridoxal-phosphate dependent enzyme [Pseudonocardia sp.]|mgnify:CR=1 FL=1|jgi:threonine dehydratase|uniref:threonine ammonia-lyase n=1 Tax=Pseudonocardia sp. TaxID=60912 RepID=UPI002B4B3D9D|nr:pyridoxal-phosphate dependent enzyme [Pseudonocardia sp.]HLU55204.1 pyridoxal-phosphate dependent enzyme [Pseudonocardia sp.]